MLTTPFLMLIEKCQPGLISRMLLSAVIALGGVSVLADHGGAQPRVLVQPEAHGGHECLLFAFDSLPENFALGTIELAVVDATGPFPFSGDLSASIAPRPVHAKLPVTHLTQRIPITISRTDASFQAEKAGDAWQFYYCLMLDRPGVGGSITVVPTFYWPSGDEIASIDIRLPDGASLEDGVTIDVSHPPNVLVIMAETTQS